jgi:hypothetical protein
MSELIASDENAETQPSEPEIRDQQIIREIGDYNYAKEYNLEKIRLIWELMPGPM